MDSSADDANKLSHATRRAFCTDLLLTSTALVLAAPTVTEMRAGGQVWAVGKSFGSNTEMIVQGPRRSD